MTTRPSPWPHGAPCWATLATADEQRARAFYADVLGWSFRDIGPRQHDWTLAEAAGGVVAGIGAVREDGESSWLLGFASDDLKASAAAVVNAGGSLLVPPHDVLEGAAQFAVARGPGGARFGLLGAGGFAGFSAVNAPGAVVWEDAVVDDPQAGRDFFAAVFGWTFTPEPRAGADYAMFGPGGDAPPWGGYGGNPHELPPYWCVWFGVDSVDAAVDRVIAGDGGVVGEPGDGPWGRTARVEDPDGAVFGLMEADWGAFPDRTA